MWVKICGNTNLEDAALAAELGADAVGFVFAASKRRVTAAQVAAITPHLPVRVEKVGVFDSHDAEEIAAAALQAGLTAVQLHGGLDEVVLERLGRIFAGRVNIIQTLHWVVNGDSTATISPGDQLGAQLQRVAQGGATDRVLIDSKVGALGGGTGVAFDWAAARRVFVSAPTGLHLIVAGGLKPESVAGAISQLQPWGVDVCSGVEASPGRKDPAKLAQFIENARKLPMP